MMPDRLSRLLRATLRRRSHSALPQDKKADSKAVDSNGPGGSSHAQAHADDDHDDNHLQHPHQHHDVTAKSRAYSVVSSLPVDHPSSPDEIVAAPATPATSYSTDHQGRVVQLQHRQYFDPVEPSPTEIVPVVRPDEVVARRGSEASVLEQVVQQQKPIQKSAESLEPLGPTTTTTTTTATAARDLQPDSSTVLQNPDPFGSTSTTTTASSSSQPVKRPVVDPSLPPVAEFGNQPSATSSKRPSLVIRRQSLLPVSHHHLVRNLLDQPLHPSQAASTTALATTTTEMQARKIWVRRPGGSPTLVPILEDAVVDELRDQVILKYTNSLGKTFDSPDIVIRVVPREGLGKQPERLLNPEESLVAVVDTYYPGGQRVDEALIIDIPGRRTPKPSPRVYYHNDSSEHDYFSIVPMNPSTPPSHTANSSVSANAQATPSISILTTGKAPPLPSPGSTRTNRHARRPPAIRHTTGSPTIAQKETVASPVQAQAPTAVPTPPIPPAPESPQAKALTPPPARGTSPRGGGRPSLKDKKNSTSPLFNSAFNGLNEGTVPPINVLIVEDNIINQKLLEAFMKRLSVRWKCAGNGEEAVKKWRQGGFHLVLMDIQLPVMNGLEATKEIRRLERLNGIGVFPKTPDGRASATKSVDVGVASEAPAPSASLAEEDTLHDRTLFKSPVIIVALTASSLQSDRHEALAAGCNDFLTKPVGFPWLEQKVTEWGCMQALIDFEGWRRWRGFDNPVDGEGGTENTSTDQPDQPGQGEAAAGQTLVPSPPQAQNGVDGERYVSPMHSSVVTPVPTGDGGGS